jgi:hypothetical protein
MTVRNVSIETSLREVSGKADRSLYYYAFFAQREMSYKLFINADNTGTYDRDKQ